MDTRQKLSLLWIFLFLNFIFCDVFSLMYPPTIQELAAGNVVNGIEMSQGLLLGFAIVMELGMVMILASRLLAPGGLNRWLNIGIGAGLIVVQVGSLMAGDNTAHYLFFSAVEVATLVAIVLIALRWQT